MRFPIFGTFALLLFQSLELCRAAEPPVTPLSATGTLGAARVTGSSNELTVGTGAIERRWRWTGRGLVTVGLRDLHTGAEWARPPQRTCDWDLPGALGDTTAGTLIDNTARVSDDDGFSGRHLEVVTTVRYETGADRLALNKTALDERFFVLGSGLAGDVLHLFDCSHEAEALPVSAITLRAAAHSSSSVMSEASL